MSRFVEPDKKLDLVIEVKGEKKKITLEKDQYYFLKREKGKDVPVIKHDALIRIADRNDLKIDKTILEFGQFHSPNNFCFVHRAITKLEDGTIIDEVGEANPKNLDTAIGGAYPAIMSNKRAQDRLLIRLMGLQGQVYSDTEFGADDSKPASKVSEEGYAMTVEEAKALIVDYGSYRSAPITLEELQKNAPNDFNWLLNNYRISPRSSEKMKKLHYGAKILAENKEG